jgi:hypothetical protein
LLVRRESTELRKREDILSAADDSQTTPHYSAAPSQASCAVLTGESVSVWVRLQASSDPGIIRVGEYREKRDQ